MVMSSGMIDGLNALWRRVGEVASVQDETAAKVNAVPAVLKVFVILGGVALLVGTIMLAALVMLRMGDGEPSDLAEQPAGPVDLALPKDVRVNQVVADGRRLILLGEAPDGQQYIAVVDARSGERESLIRLAPEE
jgi:hypothetical protein